MCLAAADARTIYWAGKNWLVKDGTALGPGPNDWSDSTNNVWVDTNGYLHLKITESGGNWYCAEITSEQSFGYGEYRFLVGNRIDQLDTNVVGGLFTYLDDDNEIDIEFVRAWTGTNNANFVNQPARPGNTYDYYIDLVGELSTHRFIWETNSIYYQSYHAHGAPPPDPSFEIAEWTYSSNDVPVAGSEKVHLNMWLFQGRSPTDTQHLEMVVRDFIFVPSTNAPPPAPLVGFIDDFNDQALSNAWTYFNSAELSVETNGTLRVVPPGDLTSQAGVVTTNPLTWSAASGCVFQAEIDWIDVTVSGSSNAIDVKTMMAAVSEANSPWFATNAAILLGAYSETNDTLSLSFATKTGAPSSMGTERYSGIISNVSDHVGNGGLTLQFELDADEYRIRAVDTDGFEVDVDSVPASGVGDHYLGTTLTNTYWALGGQNWWDGTAYIYYDQTHVYATNAISTNVPPPPSATNIVAVGSSSQRRRNPVNAYWEQARMQTMYFADEIGWTGELVKIEINVARHPKETLSNYTIRVQHTSSNEMHRAWISNGWTVVFQEHLDITNDGWHAFFLTNTFSYNGTNNLVIDFSKDTDGWHNSGYAMSSDDEVTRTYEQQIDGADSPLTWTGQEPLRYDYYPPALIRWYPNIRLTFVTQDTDSDGDGIPDTWELTYFSSLTEADETSDNDDDRFPDLHEYAAGTVPTDNGSLLRMGEPLEDPSGGVVVRWDSVSGKSYVLHRASNLVYQFETIATNLAATPSMNTYTDNTATLKGPYYYRVELE
jgi:hypothetical protein